MPRANVDLLCQVPVIADSEPADVSTARSWYAGIDAAADGRSLRLPSSGTSVASARREAGADLVHVDLAGLGDQLLERLLGQRARLRRAR